MQLGHLYIHTSEGRGRGVFAARAIEVGEVIEICPMLVFSKKETKHLVATSLYNYYFEWGEKANLSAIALGYGSLYNHSYTPNAQYEADFEDNTLTVYCIKPIAVGDEITFNYNNDSDDDTQMWFDLAE